MSVCLSNERVFGWEMMVDQADGDLGLSTDPSNRQPVVPEFLQALNSCLDKRLAARIWQLALKARFGVFFFARFNQAARLSRPRLKSARISRAALCPGAPVTPPPGWVPALHM